MKVVEIIKLSRKMLELLHESCIKINDVQYLDLYEEYLSIVSTGGKSTYAVAALSETYHVSERHIYYIIKKFEKDCKICAPKKE